MKVIDSLIVHVVEKKLGSSFKFIVVCNQDGGFLNRRTSFIVPETYCVDVPLVNVSYVVLTTVDLDTWSIGIYPILVLLLLIFSYTILFSMIFQYVVCNS